jgi:glycosyltransferase involved in cell wall biosynthesis
VYWGRKLNEDRKSMTVNANGKATVIIPVRNGESTLGPAFDSLVRQEGAGLIEEIIIIDDCSTDGSLDLIADFAETSPFEVELRGHDRARGLAANYNEGILATRSKFFILMHQDVVLQETDSFERILEPFASEPGVVAARPSILHPHDIWKTYGFWQKCLLSRHVEKASRSLAGKFDCYDRELFLEKVGLFDEKNFKTAGEDADIKARLSANQAKVVQAEVNVIHLHSGGTSFGLRELIRKEAQHQESLGAALHKHRPWGPWEFVLTFFRPLLVVGLLIPYVQVVSLISILVYAFLYTKLVYQEEYRDPRVLALPFVNIALLFIDTVYFARGLVTGKQRAGP